MAERGEGMGEPGARKVDREHLREVLYLVEQAAEGGIKVLPGKRWAYHYPADGEQRAATLRSLLQGKMKPEEAAASLKPDGLLFDVADLEEQGLEAVSRRILDLSTQAAHYDYARFADFASRLQGLEVSEDQVETLYNGIIKSRVQQKLRDAFGTTGRRQMEALMRSQADQARGNLPHLSRPEKILAALKLDWLCDDLSLVDTVVRDQALSELSGDEREVVGELRQAYRQFVQSGDESSYQTLVENVRAGLPKMQESPPHEELSESMQKLEEELKPFEDQVGPPGTPEDPAIPPEDADEYHTPPISPGESREQTRARPIFEIEPPLSGFYASGRKSYYDIERKTWSKRKQLGSYVGSELKGERRTLSGQTDAGVKSIPLPNGFAIDRDSLKVSGAPAELLRDQNGCFYIKTEGVTSFSLEFGQEATPFVGASVPEDTAPLTRAPLSDETEAALGRLTGGVLHKAEQARQYIRAHHFYPSGGDLQKAQALQAKLRHESSGDAYLQNLDRSEYLECYSANTLFIAMMRQAGVPARLVVGHRVEGGRDGKSVMNQNTGHAWSEIWNPSTGQWVRFDATPPPKPEDKKPEGGEKQEGAPEAQDGGVEGPPEPPPQAGAEAKGEEMAEASDQEVQQSSRQVSEAQQEMQRMQQTKDQLDQKISESQSFKDLKNLEQETAKADLLEEMKEELEQKLEAQEEKMKQELRDEIEQMADDGFLDEAKRDQLEERLDRESLEALERLQEEIRRESGLYEEYERIREEMQPLVDQWYRYFAERLPRQEDVERDEDALTRQGAFDRRSIRRPRNIIFGTVKNPRVIRPTIKPKFLASVMVDVSGSMAGEKLNNARRLLVFYSELFTRISHEFGYIRFNINCFSDSVTEIKAFDQDYDSPRRYAFPDGQQSTVKLRLMERVRTAGGTNMLDAVQKAATDLNNERYQFSDYASALYFVGDGQDTQGNSGRVREFLRINDAEHGFGEHMLSSIMLGDESQRQVLADIFGEERTSVAGNLEELIETSMVKFDKDIEEYLAGKTI